MNCECCGKNITADREWRIRENMSSEPKLCTGCDQAGRIWAAQQAIKVEGKKPK